jgi:hypothetical protein
VVEGGDRPVEFRQRVPKELQTGSYANLMAGWLTPYEFTLDFAVTQEPQVPEDAADPVTIPCILVSRVKIPVTIIFDVLRALSDLMTAYERLYGEIQQPRPRGADA